MKITQPKRILIALAIGLVLSLLSLLYFRDATMLDTDCNGVVCTDVSDYKKVGVSVHGFPFSAVVLKDDGSLDYVTLSLFVGNWMLYSILSFVGLQFWRPKAKVV